MKRHANAAVFVPHAGCVHRCAFCDQRGISGAPRIPTDEEVAAVLNRAAESLAGKPGEVTAQVAFFGGSFTAIPRTEMLRLLEAAQPFLANGVFSGIRVSTRPDAVDEDVLDILADYGVTAVELGAQSMDDAVLSACGRGHTAADVETAAARVRARGFSLGLQMMTGLPMDSDEGAMRTAVALAGMKPDTVRVYPTLVLEGAALANLWRGGSYVPQTLESAVELCSELLAFFTDSGISVIRLGLHDEPSLKTGLLAGPWHPAFRELCEAKIMLRRAFEALDGIPPGKVTLAVGTGATSRMTGQRRANIKALTERGYTARVTEQDGIPYLRVRVITG